MITIREFQKTIRAYYRAHRRGMPWRRAADLREPYRILVSEIMLQQTQVARVVPFYENFIKKFPDFKTLARAKTPEVLKAWQGLGYNRRALALQKLAREVTEKYNGELPRTRDELIALPGIGNYTAGAVRAFAFNEPEIFIETNIRRVFIHFFFPRRARVTDTHLIRYIERSLDRKNPREWCFALMDYGAMLGERARATPRATPRSGRAGEIIKNPNRRSAHYIRQSTFLGSDREIRGKVLRELLAKKKLPIAGLAKTLKEPTVRVLKIVAGLQKEGFLVEKGNYIALV